MAHGLEAPESPEQRHERVMKLWSDFFKAIELPEAQSEDILNRTTVNDDGSISIEGNLNLFVFKTLPPFPTHIEEITGRLSLRSLESAEHLVLPDSLQELYLNSLTPSERNALRAKYPKVKIFPNP
jgi:hypothetical protein